MTALVRRFLGLSAASVLGAVSTYVLFLAFAHTAALEPLGLYGLWMAAVGAVVNLLVAVTEQRVAQMFGDDVTDGVSAESLLQHYAAERAWLLAGVSALLGIAASMVTGQVGLGAAVAVAALGQGSYGIVLGPRVFGGRRRQILAIQAANAALIMLVATVLLGGVGGVGPIGVEAMLVLTGSVRLLGTLPFAWAPRRGVGAGPHAPLPLAHVLFARHARRATTHLIALQGVNAVTVSADSLVLGLAGPSAVGSYQLVQRPMLGLGVLNGALGQLAYNELLHRGSLRLERRRAAVAGVAVVAAWTASGAVVYEVVRRITPSDVDVSLLVCLGLGLAYGLGALAAVTGPALVVSGRSRSLLVAGVAQAGVLVAAGVLLVPVLGVVGVVAALVVARVVVVLVQLGAVRRPLATRTGSDARRATDPLG